MDRKATNPRTSPVVVIKIGTSSLIRPEQNTLNLTSLSGIVETVRALRDRGFEVVLVSSGAVGVGAQRLGLKQRPTELAKKQALAAIGQIHLMRFYEDLMTACGLTCAQVLLTLENFANRGQYYNAANTFAELLHYGVVPIANENDTVGVEQLRIGDNDTLSAQVATLVHADWLFLLTDVDALYTANPSVDPNAKPIREVPDLSTLAVDTSTHGTQWGTGGMATKLTAARMATAGGCNMAICHFAEPRNILRILDGEPVGTVFHASASPVKGQRRWVLSVPARGALWLDDHAVRAVRDRKCSLFASGIVKVEGDFQQQDVVSLHDRNGREFARGLCNYGYETVEASRGMSSKQFLKEFGSKFGQEELVHRAFICMLVQGDEDYGNESDGDEELERPGSALASSGGMSRSATPGLVSALVPPEAEIAARLAVLAQRDSAAEDSAWRAELAAAVADEIVPGAVDGATETAGW